MAAEISCLIIMMSMKTVARKTGCFPFCRD
jgi:hypothetical protein